jgi:lipid II:glycine glycyltransferase (peptidoglycan interpeptide bridge formation enzyme)
LVACLQDYVSALGLAGIEMGIGPSIYAEHPNDTQSFAVAASGFSLASRWLVHVLVLPQNPRDLAEQLPSERRASYVRAALRQGAEVTRVGVEHLPRFYDLLAANRARHSARPTHTLSELERIFDLTPNRVQLYVCKLGEEMIAGTLIFELNDRVAYSFYPCHDERFARYRPDAVVLLGVAEQYAARGFRYLDLGPTTFDDFRLNHGLARFKEEMGGLGFCRDSWRWEARPPVPSRSED